MHKSVETEIINQIDQKNKSVNVNTNEDVGRVCIQIINNTLSGIAFVK
jgi:GTP:adenosylcobinamide-phosphate guanylyltransferase